jgi:hypothetical protein
VGRPYARPDGNAVAYALIERRIGGRRALTHGGDLSAYATMMTLVPEARLGVIIMFNSPDTRATDPFPGLVMQGLLPTIELHAPLYARTNSSDFAGAYHPTRQNFSSIEKLRLYFDQRNVVALLNGDLVMRYDGRPARWSPIADTVFALAGSEGASDERLLFRRVGGAVTGFEFLNGPQSSFYRVPWYLTQQTAHNVVTVVALATLGLLAYAGLRRPQGSAANIVLWLALAAGVLNLAFAWLVPNYLQSILESGEGVDLPRSLPFVLTLPLVALFATTVALGVLARARPSPWTLVVCSALAIGANSVFALLLYQWNLLGYRY